MNAAANATKTAPVPYADRPEYTSWRLMGKMEGHDHEVVFMVNKADDGVAVLHTISGGRSLDGGGSYAKWHTAITTREPARALCREYLGKGYRWAP